MIQIKDYGPVINSDTIEAALADVPSTGCRVVFPHGVFQLQRTIILNKYNTTLVGECSGLPRSGMAATELIFPPGVEGISIKGKPNGQGDWCGVFGLTLSTSGGTANGITARGASCQIENCGVYRFGGTGIMVEGGVVNGQATGVNSNSFTILRSCARECGGHGVHINGNDANKGTITDVSCSSNGGWGFKEYKTLGNNYFSCHTAVNTLGGYLIDGPSAFSTLIGCYSEGGQPISWVGQKVVVLGGHHGSGIDLTNRMNDQGVLYPPGSWVSSDGYGLRLSRIEQLLASGLTKPTIPGTANQFVPITKQMGWHCTSPGNWILRWV